jgi:hypothetical protein
MEHNLTGLVWLVIELNLDENNSARSGFGRSKLSASISCYLNVCLLHNKESGILAFLFVWKFIMMVECQSNISIFV